VWGLLLFAKYLFVHLFYRATHNAARSGRGRWRAQILVHNVATGREVDAAFANMAQQKPDALFVAPGSFFNTRRIQLAVLAARHALPAIYPTRAYPEAGGLMSYGTDVLDAFRHVGVYTASILKGAKPADLPVLQSTKFELVINLNTARALDLTVPSGLLAARRRGD
jgi:putative ABC transport system substrate-binding protein